jgi:hypothetical protein
LLKSFGSLAALTNSLTHLEKGADSLDILEQLVKNDYLELTNILSLTAFDCASKLDMIVDIEDTM